MTRPKTPPDHPMQQVWANNEKFLSIEGTIELARTGDEPALRTLLGSCVMKIERGRPLDPEVAEFISECLVNYLGGLTLDEAFYRRKRKPGSAPPDSAALLRKAEIAWRVGDLKGKHPESSIADICGDVAYEYEIEGADPGDAVRKIWNAYSLPADEGNQ